MKGKIEALTDKVNALEQYSPRKSNVIINGILERRYKYLRRIIVKKIAGKLDLELQEYDVQAIYKLPSKNQGKARFVIKRLSSYDKRPELIMRSKIKKINSDCIELTPSTPIFVDEHLTSVTIEG